MESYKGNNQVFGIKDSEFNKNVLHGRCQPVFGEFPLVRIYIQKYSCWEVWL